MENLVTRAGKKGLGRIFTADEQSYCDSKRMKLEHYAARYAAKEAVLKALKIKRGKRQRLSEIEVKRHPSGKPFIVISARARERWRVPPRAQIELSMAHEREYAIATVVIVLP